MKLGLKMVDVRILKIDSEMTTPHYAHEGDAAFDLRSAEEIIIPAKGRYTVKSGIKMAIPEGYFGLIKDRSGYAHKKGIHCLAGVIDSGYRGEVGVVMVNLGDEDFDITKDMRIAQMLILPVPKTNLILSEDLDDSVRNEGGFGSTGTH
jgi:dUTP pyrophosphatase